MFMLRGIHDFTTDFPGRFHWLHVLRKEGNTHFMLINICHSYVKQSFVAKDVKQLTVKLTFGS